MSALNSPAILNSAGLLARIFLAFIFVSAGFSKIGGYAGTAAFMDSRGVPGLLLPLVIAAEIGLGLMLLVGYQARLAALGLAGFTLLAGYLFHFIPGNQGEMTHFFKNVAITGGMLAVFAMGGGAFAVDNVLGKGKSKTVAA
jgi:putative oxidoreductase